MLMEYIVPTLRIVVIVDITDVSVVEKIILQLLQFEEDHFVAGYHENIKNK